MSDELALRIVEEDELALSDREWRDQFKDWGIQFSLGTGTHVLRDYAAMLTPTCEEHLANRMVCVCSYPTIPDVNDLFTVTFRQKSVSAVWLKWGESGHFLLTPMLKEHPFTTFCNHVYRPNCCATCTEIHDEKIAHPMDLK